MRCFELPPPRAKLFFPVTIYRSSSWNLYMMPSSPNVLLSSWWHECVMLWRVLLLSIIWPFHVFITDVKFMFSKKYILLFVVLFWTCVYESGKPATYFINPHEKYQQKTRGIHVNLHNNQNSNIILSCLGNTCHLTTIMLMVNIHKFQLRLIQWRTNIHRWISGCLWFGWGKLSSLKVQLLGIPQP